MLDVYDLLAFKNMYEYHKIIYVLFENREFVFKSLTRKEYKEILDLTSNDGELEDLICEVACLYPKDYDFANTPIGAFPQQIAPLIAKESGFVGYNNLSAIYDEAKKEMKTFDTQCMCFIKTAFPEYEYKDIENWTYEKLIKVALKAEYILNLKGYDIHLNNNLEDIKEEDKQNKQVDLTTNKKFINMLDMTGIDPMEYFKTEIQKDMEVKYIDKPFIGSLYWWEDSIIDEIRNQMEKRKLE